jgi:hypothetical protein
MTLTKAEGNPFFDRIRETFPGCRSLRTTLSREAGGKVVQVWQNWNMLGIMVSPR